jgi:FtsP/CotA-like multicopper oxidase with cupredoxin domain
MRRLLFAVMAAGFVAAGADAQPATCTPPSDDFVKVPELVSSGGKLKGTIIAVEQQQCISVRFPPTLQDQTSKAVWRPQIVRTMRLAGKSGQSAPANTYPYPLPGPTLRARVGDLVELTLLNEIDPNRFPYSIDQDQKPGGGCDQTSLYPGTGKYSDTFPNCFHGSSTVNLHFHGTHVNPNSTGDNVFVQIRPFPRTTAGPSRPVIDSDLQDSIDKDFFPRCEKQLTPQDPLNQFPFVWTDLPKLYRNIEMKLLQNYDTATGLKLWEENDRLINRGMWPQFYIGAYPYCYRIPEYKGGKFPIKIPDNVISGPEGMDHSNMLPRPLVMGQAPGTHWYHAHKHGSTAIDVANGMTGAFIIEGQYDDDLNAFYGKDWTRRQPVIIIQQIDVGPNLERGGGGFKDADKKLALGQDSGPSFSINGRLVPLLKMAPNEVQMWRIVNSSPRAGVYLDGPPAGFHWRQIAQDGVQYSNTNYQDPGNVDGPLYLASGNRADMLVMAPPKPIERVEFLAQNLVDPTENTLLDPPKPGELPMLHFKKNPLLRVTVTNTSPATGNAAKFIDKAPSLPPFLVDILPGEVQGTKTVKFASEYPLLNGNPPVPPQRGAPGPAIHTIDGEKFSGNVGKVVRLNTVEEWTISNETYGTLIAHPFHIHLNPFQVVEVFAPNEQVPDGTGNFVNRYVFDKEALKVPGQCYLDPHDPTTWKPCNPPPPRPGNMNNIWWDVFPIPSGALATNAKKEPINDAAGKQVEVPGYFKMRSRFVDYSGWYVLHCHILGHEDRGMMMIVEVTPLEPPFTHH